MSKTSLAAAPSGVPAVVRTVEGSSAHVRRLAELGIRRAALITPMHRTSGGGRVIDVAGSRIALAASVLRSISTDSISTDEAP